MKKDRKTSGIDNGDLNQTLSKRQGRREFLLKTGGILAAFARIGDVSLYRDGCASTFR